MQSRNRYAVRAELISGGWRLGPQPRARRMLWGALTHPTLVERVANAAARPRRLAAGAVRRVAERALERRYGVRTGEYVYLEDLGLNPVDRVWHDASDWLALRRAVDRLDVTSDDVFVDYGSGLGRAAIVAATFPFRRVIGVEVSSEMTERARAHVERTRGCHKARSVELVVSDALDWDVPSDVTIAYLYSPFTGDVFDGVIRRLLASLDEHPRPLRLVYNYPVEHSRLVRTGRVRVLEVGSSLWPAGPLDDSHVIVTYLLLPSDPARRREYEQLFPRRVEGAEQWLEEYEPGYVLEKPARLGGVALERPKQR